MQNTTGMACKIKRLESDASSNIEELEYLKETAINWGEEIRTGKLNWMDVGNDLNARVMKALEYPIPIKTFSFVKCCAILRTVLEGGLPASGICRSMHHEIVHAPLKYQEINIPSLHYPRDITCGGSCGCFPCRRN